MIMQRRPWILWKISECQNSLFGLFIFPFN